MGIFNLIWQNTAKVYTGKTGFHFFTLFVFIRCHLWEYTTQPLVIRFTFSFLFFFFFKGVHAALWQSTTLICSLLFCCVSRGQESPLFFFFFCLFLFVEWIESNSGVIARGWGDEKLLLRPIAVPGIIGLGCFIYGLHFPRDCDKMNDASKG